MKKNWTNHSWIGAAPVSHQLLVLRHADALAPTSFGGFQHHRVANALGALDGVAGGGQARLPRDVIQTVQWCKNNKGLYNMLVTSALVKVGRFLKVCTCQKVDSIKWFSWSDQQSFAKKMIVTGGQASWKSHQEWCHLWSVLLSVHLHSTEWMGRLSWCSKQSANIFGQQKQRHTFIMNQNDIISPYDMYNIYMYIYICCDGSLILISNRQSFKKDQLKESFPPPNLSLSGFPHQPFVPKSPLRSCRPARTSWLLSEDVLPCKSCEVVWYIFERFRFCHFCSVSATRTEQQRAIKCQKAFWFESVRDFAEENMV